MSISSNTVPKDSGDWFSQMSRRMRILERHRHEPTAEDSLTLLTTQAEVIQSMSAGFGFVAVQFITDGSWAQFHIGISRTGADLASNTDGNITNVGMGFLLPQWQPAMFTSLITDIGGQLAAGYIDTGGQFVIGALPPGSPGTWVSGKTIYFGATYMLKSTLAV
jgi:hypothetical protein